jgi:glycosyltransferase involved in cell wall biosynthesis
MKILLLTTHMNFGGISSYTFSLAKILVELGHDVYCASSNGDICAQLEKNGIRYLPIPINTKSELSPKVLISLIKLLLFHRKEKFDILHAQTRVTQVLAWYFSKITKIPYVTTCHGFFRKHMGRQIFPCWGQIVFAISDAVKKHLMIDFYVPSKNIALVPNGIEVEKFTVAEKRADPKYKDRAVGIIARLSSVKGHIYLIQAMAEVIKEFPDAKLYIFGHGNNKYELVRLVEKLKITENVFFLPAVSNTAKVLQEIDIFVMPSIQEGLGLSILEAQASGLPVVASNVGGIPTIVKHDISGLLCPPKNPAALSGAILRLMEDRGLAIRLGQKGRQDVESMFNLQIMTSKIEKVYKEVLGIQ